MHAYVRAGKSTEINAYIRACMNPHTRSRARSRARARARTHARTHKYIVEDGNGNVPLRMKIPQMTPTREAAPQNRGGKHWFQSFPSFRIHPFDAWDSWGMMYVLNISSSIHKVVVRRIASPSGTSLRCSGTKCTSYHLPVLRTWSAKRRRRLILWPVQGCHVHPPRLVTHWRGHSCEVEW